MLLQCTVMDSNVNTRTVFFFFLLLVDLKRIMNRFDIEMISLFENMQKFKFLGVITSFNYAINLLFVY